MIKMIKGTYGRVVDGAVEAMTKHSAPFTLSEKREAELVAAGVAVMVEEPANEYTGMKMAELRKLAEKRGINVTGVKSKNAIIALLEAAEVLDTDDGKKYSGLTDEG